MAEPFIGEIRMFGFDYAPQNWAKCDGALLPITQNAALYSLLGTQFGGDGRTNFKLPDMRGRVPVDLGPNITQGQSFGAEIVSLNPNTMGQHTHPIGATTQNADVRNPDQGILAETVSEDRPIYGPPTNLVNMRTDALTSAGSGQAHDNMQPYQVINFCIALDGLFPSRS